MGVIVVGVDESASARAALRWAVDQGRRRRWTVRAVLAWSYLDQHDDRGEGSFRPDYTEQDAVDVLDRLVDEAAAGDAIERIVTCDLPARALLEASRAADLLVLGARSRGGTRSGWASVGQRCALRAVVPVTIVRPTGSAVGVKRVVVGVDGSDHSVLALRWGLEEARLRGAGVTVAYAHPRSRSVPGRESRLAGRTVEAMLEECDTSGLVGRVDTAVAERDGLRALVAASSETSLIVVGSDRSRGGLAGRLIRQADSAAASSVVVVPSASRSVH